MRISFPENQVWWQPLLLIGKIFRYHQYLLRQVENLRTNLLSKLRPAKMIRTPLSFSSTFYLTKFELIWNPAEGHQLLESRKGCGKAISVAIFVSFIIRAVLFVPALPFLMKPKMLTKDGCFTLDAFLETGGVLTGVMGLMIILVYYIHEQEIKEMFNFHNQISTGLVSTCYDPNGSLLDVRPFSPRLLIVSIFLRVSVFLLPVYTMVEVLCLRTSPLTLIGQMSVQSTAKGESTFGDSALWLVGFVVDWGLLLIFFSSFPTFVSLYFETAEQMTIAFKVLRSVEFVGTGHPSRLRQAHHYMMQLDLVNTRLNLMGHRLFPLVIFSLVFAAILSISGSVRLNQTLFECVSLPLAYFVVGTIAVFTVVSVYMCIRPGEDVMAESILTFKMFSQLQHGSRSVWGRAQGNLTSVIMLKRRVFERKPVVVKIGVFMAIENGVAFVLLQSVLENVFTGITILDANVPSKLLCT